MKGNRNTTFDQIKLRGLKEEVRRFIIEITGEEEVLPPATYHRVLRGKGSPSSRALVALAYHTMPSPTAEQPA